MSRQRGRVLFSEFAGFIKKNLYNLLQNPDQIRTDGTKRTILSGFETAFSISAHKKFRRGITA